MPPCWVSGSHENFWTSLIAAAKLGYKQELRRNFTMIEVFGIAFSIMGLLPSIASTLAYSIPAGPVGMVWGWFIASAFIFIVGVAMVGFSLYQITEKVSLRSSPLLPCIWGPCTHVGRKVIIGHFLLAHMCWNSMSQ